MLSESLNALAELPPVSELLLKLTALLTIAWSIKPLLRRANPRWQVFYWRAVAATTLLLPLVVLLGPTLPVPLLGANATEPAAIAVEAPVSQVSSTAPMHLFPPQNHAETLLAPRKQTTGAEIPSAPTESIRSLAAGRQSMASPPSRWSWVAILATAWLLPALLLTVGALISEWRMAQLVRQAEAAPTATAELLAQVARDLGYARPIRACLSSQVDSPRVTGILRPSIVLSKTADASDTTDLRGIFAHEVNHLLSRDLSWSRVFQALSIALWFHPLVWRLGRQHLDACERVSDAAAAEYVGDASTYAATLARIALGVIGRQRLLAGIAMARQPGICDRLQRLQHVVSAAPLRRRHAVPLLLAGLLLLTAVGGMQLVQAGSSASPSDPEPAEATADEPVDGVKVGATYDCKLVDAVSRKPVPGATVTVQLRISGGGKTFKQWPTVRKTDYTTGPKGEYKIEILPDEQNRSRLYVELETSHPDYVDSYGGYSYTMIKKNLEMGEQPFFTARLVFPAVKLTGTVVTPDGRPAEGVLAFGSTRLDLDDHRTGGHYFNGKTDAAGRFEFKGIRGGESVVWVSPKDYCPSTLVVEHDLSEMSHMVMEFLHVDTFAPDSVAEAAKVRDLGRIVLEEGARIRGRVVDVEGSPMEGVWVNARIVEGPAKKDVGRGFANVVARSALTDADGRYEMRPLPPSTYRVAPGEEPEEKSAEDVELRPLPAEFLPQTVTLLEGDKTATVDMQAVPHVTIAIQYYKSSGERRPGSEVWLSGRAGDEFWSKRGNPDADGRIEINTPKGLEQVRINLITNEHSSLRHRITKDGPLLNSDDIELGTVSNDMKEIAVIRYVAPVLLVQAVDEAGTPINGFEARLMYGPDRSPLGGGEYLRNNRPVGHVGMEQQTDGRWRTSQLLPDEPFKLTVEAPGYETVEEKFSLPEGETREVKVTLKKAVP